MISRHQRAEQGIIPQRKQETGITRSEKIEPVGESEPIRLRTRVFEPRRDHGPSPQSDPLCRNIRQQTPTDQRANITRCAGPAQRLDRKPEAEKFGDNRQHCDRDQRFDGNSARGVVGKKLDGRVDQKEHHAKEYP